MLFVEEKGATIEYYGSDVILKSKTIIKIVKDSSVPSKIHS